MGTPSTIKVVNRPGRLLSVMLRVLQTEHSTCTSTPGRLAIISGRLVAPELLISVAEMDSVLVISSRSAPGLAMADALVMVTPGKVRTSVVWAHAALDTRARTRTRKAKGGVFMVLI